MQRNKTGHILLLMADTAFHRDRIIPESRNSNFRDWFEKEMTNCTHNKISVMTGKTVPKVRPRGILVIRSSNEKSKNHKTSLKLLK